MEPFPTVLPDYAVSFPLPISASVWCSMFSGKLPEEHEHENYVVNGEIVKREDIKVDFIWDVLSREGKKVRALNVPFVVPPYSFGVDFKPVGFGLPTNEKVTNTPLPKKLNKSIKREVEELL